MKKRFLMLIMGLAIIAMAITGYASSDNGDENSQSSGEETITFKFAMVDNESQYYKVLKLLSS